MKTLLLEFRRHLERTVADARDVAEGGARAALEALAVHEHEPYEHMSAEQRALRRRLRAHARQLGDRRDARSGGQAIDGLVQECAYEHWHGMLFARFLAENHLLIEPEMGVAVTLDECEELAKDESADKWALAARYAHRMLPQVFRPDLPVFEVRLAREHRLKLEGLVEGLPAGVFTATDSLGWVYQFWQSRKKAEVNRSEVKIGAGELSAVTQLFTEPYMVGFLLDNTLGAWWAARRLSGADLDGAGGEAGLRRKAAIPGVPLDSLRFVQDAPATRLPRDPAGAVPPTSDEAPSAGFRDDRDDSGDGRPHPPTPDQPPPAAGERARSLRGDGGADDGATAPGWRPAAGTFGGWPEHLGGLKILDPCCGSGHFLVAAFLMLVPMRMAREGLAPAMRWTRSCGTTCTGWSWTRDAWSSRRSPSPPGRIPARRGIGPCRSSTSPARDWHPTQRRNSGPHWRSWPLPLVGCRRSATCSVRKTRCSPRRSATAWTRSTSCSAGRRSSVRSSTRTR